MQDVGNLHLAGLQRAFAAARSEDGLRSGNGSPAGRAMLMSCWPFSSASTIQPPDRPGLARSASRRNSARSSASSAADVARTRRHRDLLAQQRVDGAGQRAGGIEDGLALIVALVFGEPPDDARGQQQERQRHRQRNQHQAVADAPALVLLVQKTPPSPSRKRTAGGAAAGGGPPLPVVSCGSWCRSGPSSADKPASRPSRGPRRGSGIAPQCSRRSATEYRSARRRSLPS